MAKSGIKRIAKWLVGFLSNSYHILNKISNPELHEDQAFLRKPSKIRQEGYMTMVSFGEQSSFDDL